MIHSVWTSNLDGGITVGICGTSRFVFVGFLIQEPALPGTPYVPVSTMQTKHPLEGEAAASLWN